MTKNLLIVWSLMIPEDQKRSYIALLAIIVNALLAVAGIGGIMPFLIVLTDPTRINSIPTLQWAYEVLEPKSIYQFLVVLGSISFVLTILSNLSQLFLNWYLVRFSQGVIYSLSIRLLESYLAQPYEFFLNRHTGEMAPKVLGEARQVVQSFVHPMTSIVAGAITMFAIIVLLVVANPAVAIASFALFGGSYLAVFLLARALLVRLGTQRITANRARFRYATEALVGIKHLKLLGQEKSYLERYSRPAYVLSQVTVAISILTGIPRLVLQTVAFGGIILICLLLISPDQFEAGATPSTVIPILALFAFAGQRLLGQFSSIYAAFASIQTATAAIESVSADLLASKLGAELKDIDADPLDFETCLELKDVYYSYPEAAVPGLRSINLRIQKGESVGIVGTTGAGKTTLVDIILGLLEPTRGSVVIDGTPLTRESIRSWMRTVGYVPQDIFLTDASILENVALGVPVERIDVTRAENACRIAQLHQFIVEELDQGYQTKIGERGVRLSGGQRQRIGIARALYNQADVIVFDEATSALDNQTEREVMTSIDALSAEKTVIMIAHRLSTVQNCQKIVVLEKGEIVGCDSWSNLLASNEAFRRLVRTLEEADENSSPIA